MPRYFSTRCSTRCPSRSSRVRVARAADASAPLPSRRRRPSRNSAAAFRTRRGVAPCGYPSAGSGNGGLSGRRAPGAVGSVGLRRAIASLDAQPASLEATNEVAIADRHGSRRDQFVVPVDRDVVMVEVEAARGRPAAAAKACSSSRDSSLTRCPHTVPCAGQLGQSMSTVIAVKSTSAGGLLC